MTEFRHLCVTQLLQGSGYLDNANASVVKWLNPIIHGTNLIDQLKPRLQILKLQLHRLRQILPKLSNPIINGTNLTNQLKPRLQISINQLNQLNYPVRDREPINNNSDKHTGSLVHKGRKKKECIGTKIQ